MATKGSEMMLSLSGLLLQSESNLPLRRTKQASAKLTKYCLNPISVLVHHYVRQSKSTLGKEDYKRICKTVTEHFVHNELSDRCLNELANNKKPTLDDIK